MNFDVALDKKFSVSGYVHVSHFVLYGIGIGLIKVVEFGVQPELR